ncbi:hypothetical protein C5O77_10210 [Limosilactobacillus reuteri]|uniref:Uncharacterized protein n=1 Tax=Limosilactobacillus reuteri TaxID=1598 RepID=A0A3M6SAG1_LIMRT|nr:hypothetical protein [Limosilactobacillus reuteri]RMX24420.1 hypothetical protein C5O77_10210 [Limosilactobacillus reuteri]
MNEKIKYIGFGLIGALIGNGMVFVFVSFFSNKYGTLADWMGGLGTIAAFLAVFWQVKKEAEIQRAMNIENQRPRFATRLIDDNNIPSKNTIILGKNDNTSEIVNAKNNNTVMKKLLMLKNISKNNIYSITVKTEYLKKNGETWENSFENLEYTGVRPYENIVIATDFKFLDEKTEYRGMVIKFVSSANEIGFMEADKTDSSPKYYYVRLSNHNISANGEDTIIDINSDKYQELNKEMDTNTVHDYRIL